MSEKSNFIREFIDSLSETALGAGGPPRPDTSGIRGQGVGRKAYPGSGNDFPYDSDRGGTTYGEPAAYSRDTAGHGGSHKGAIVPKNDDNIERWDENLDEAGNEGWAGASAPQGNIVKSPGERSKFGDEDIEAEAMGIPFNSAKAGQGTGGPAGGRVTPGTSGEWGGRPKGELWDLEISDEEITAAGLKEFLNGMPAASNLTRKVTPNAHDQTDQEIEDMIGSRVDEPEPEEDEESYDFDDLDTSFILKFGGDFGNNSAGGMKYSRMSPGFTWKENLHHSFIKEYMSISGESNMRLSINELKKVIREAVKKVKKKEERVNKKGVDGYESSAEEQPKGWAYAELGDLSKSAVSGSLYKRQGSANFGPYTSESAIRAVARAEIIREFDMHPISNSKSKASAPFNKRASVGETNSLMSVKLPEWNTTKKQGSVWEDLGRWYDIPGAKKANSSQKNFESNILKNVFKERVDNEKKKKK